MTPVAIEFKGSRNKKYERLYGSSIWKFSEPKSELGVSVSGIGVEFTSESEESETGGASDS